MQDVLLQINLSVVSSVIAQMKASYGQPIKSHLAKQPTNDWA